MYIKRVDISNYKNIKDCSIKFSWPSTYIVGENNLGKTNLLRLLHSAFNHSMLSVEDFNDPNNEVSILIQLGLEDYEVGFFNDIADSKDHMQVTIRGIVADSESEFSFLHEESGESVPAAQMRRICFFLFESLNADSRALNYNKDKGVGKVLTRSLTKYQETSGLRTLDFFDSAKVAGLIDYLNAMLGNISILSGYGIHAGIAENESGALGSIVTLTDSNELHFRHTSSGVQYVALAVMQIIEAIMRVPGNRLSKSVFQDEDGNRVLSAILAFDEPEIHLHPYMQRTLTKYLSSIACGNDSGFNSLLKEYFGIDSIRAQVIVVTHSPSMVPQDYKKLVRFYYDESSNITVRAGCDISMPPAEETRLVALFDTIKEAFFSRKVIVVEGESEVMSFPGFAETLGVDLDSIGVTIVNAHGKGSVPGVYRLLEKFGLPAWSIVDKDSDEVVASGFNRTTIHRDFEFEVIESLFANSKQDLFVSILELCEQSTGRRTMLPASQLQKTANKYFPQTFDGHTFNDEDFTGSRFDGTFADDSFTRLMMYSWMSNQKGVLFGKLIGELLPSECIPSCYSDLIKDVVQ